MTRHTMPQFRHETPHTAAAVAPVSIYDVDVCAICGAIGAGFARCAWRHEKEVTVPLVDLEVGDRVKIMPMRFERVEIVTWSQDRNTIYYKLKGSATFHTATRSDLFAPSVRGLRLAPCAAVCCANCACERAENLHYCADHWHEWSAVS